jgi:hypothetical protein
MWCSAPAAHSLRGVLSSDEVPAIHHMIRRLRDIAEETRRWPTDNAEYRKLLVELRDLERALDEKLPPAAEPLS